MRPTERDDKDGEQRASHLFGPVPSRRLGRSLGIDLVPHKVCSLDCVYCECGATTLRTLERREWVPTAEVLADLAQWLDSGQLTDYLTFSGAGEPTLHKDLGRIARWVVSRTGTPLVLLTNGTLLADPAVRAEVQPCSVVVPSLDAADDATYRKICRPHPGLTVADLIDGIVALRNEFEGQIWLEILLVEGRNDSDASLDGLAAAIERIRPDRVQLNTAVRPPAVPGVRAATADTLRRALVRFGEVAEPIAAFSPAPQAAPADTDQGRAEEAILDVVRRRPETVEALSSSLGLELSACRGAVANLRERGELLAERRAGKIYVVATERAG